MNNKTMVFVWSRNIRLFHWINVVAILLLVAIGIVIYNGKFLGLTTEAKITLKTIHVLVGYVFAINLLLRLFLGLVGRGYERFGAFLPFMPGFIGELKVFTRGKSQVHKGHNPAGKIMIAALLMMMLNQMVTGLVLAGTDIYYPPLGGHFAESVAEDKTKLSLIKPYSKENVDEAAYKEMRAFRKPFIVMHVYGFFILIALIPLHIAGVIYAERKEKASIVSAMISGYKSLPKQ